MPFKDGVYYEDESEETEQPQEVPSTPLTPAIPKPMTKSILLTTKKMLGIAEEYHPFDIDLIININSVFLNLNQLGVGPTIPFQINSTEEVWSDFLGTQEQFLAGVQTYVYLKTRLLFDPPTNSFLVDSMRKQIEELEWRFTVQPKDQSQVDYVESFKETFGENQNGSSDEEESPSEEPEETEEPNEEEAFIATTFSIRPSAKPLKVTKAPNLLDIFS